MFCLSKTYFFYIENVDLHTRGITQAFTVSSSLNLSFCGDRFISLDRMSKHIFMIFTIPLNSVLIGLRINDPIQLLAVE